MPRLLERLWGQVIAHLAHYAATGERLTAKRPAVLVRTLRSDEQRAAAAASGPGASQARTS